MEVGGVGKVAAVVVGVDVFEVIAKIRLKHFFVWINFIHLHHSS